MNEMMIHDAYHYDVSQYGNFPWITNIFIHRQDIYRKSNHTNHKKIHTKWKTCTCIIQAIHTWKKKIIELKIGQSVFQHTAGYNLLVDCPWRNFLDDDDVYASIYTYLHVDPNWRMMMSHKLPCKDFTQNADNYTIWLDEWRYLPWRIQQSSILW